MDTSLNSRQNGNGIVEACYGCGSHSEVTLQDARTAYEKPRLTALERLEYDALEPLPDPNATIPLCPDCAEEHHQHWDDMWAEYYASRL